jgi:hypothetical protein
MRELMGARCGLVLCREPRAAAVAWCGRASTTGSSILRTARWARHAGVTLPITVDTLDRAAAELDVATATAEVYRTDSALRAPQAVWDRLAAAMPELLSAP